MHPARVASTGAVVVLALTLHGCGVPLPIASRPASGTPTTASAPVAPTTAPAPSSADEPVRDPLGGTGPVDLGQVPGRGEDAAEKATTFDQLHLTPGDRVVDTSGVFAAVLNATRRNKRYLITINGNGKVATSIAGRIDTSVSGRPKIDIRSRDRKDPGSANRIIRIGTDVWEQSPRGHGRFLHTRYSALRRGDRQWLDSFNVPLRRLDAHGGPDEMVYSATAGTGADRRHALRLHYDVDGAQDYIVMTVDDQLRVREMSWYENGDLAGKIGLSRFGAIAPVTAPPANRVSEGRVR